MWKIIFKIRTSFRKKDQRLKVKGTTVFPESIINAIYEFEKINDFVVEATLDEFNSDKLCLFVTNKILQDSSIKQIKDFLKSKLLFTPEVKIVEPEVIDKKIKIGNNRKINRFKDKR